MKAENKFIPCCSFPTTVLLIDDDESFLESTSLKLGRKIPRKCYSDPVAALNFLLEQYQANPFTKRCLLRPEERSRDHRNIDVDVQAIYKEIYNPARFTEISTVVVDFAMPGLNGLEVCQQLKGSRFKVVLLTGEADEKVAIDLFNKGIIDRFVRKDNPDFMNVLVLAINQLQEEYFKDLSEIVVNSLTKNPEYPPCCLDDPVFVTFFNEFLGQHQFVEYFLLDATGSFLFLDASANPSMLIVKDETEMQGALCDAELSDTEVPADIFAAIKNKTMLLHRYIDEDYKKQPAEWKTLLYPAKKLTGRSTYYYSYVESAQSCPVDVSKVLAYKTYLSRL